MPITSTTIITTATPVGTVDSTSEVAWLEHGPPVTYTLWTAYANSKLCNLAMTYELARRITVTDGERKKVGIYRWADMCMCMYVYMYVGTYKYMVDSKVCCAMV